MISKEIENTGMAFNLKTYLNARSKTLEALNRISIKIPTGINETEGIKLIKNELELIGAEKHWHPVKFRIGSDTLKSFREKSDPLITLKENDIFFIDIGPVFSSHEADIGRTFVRGSSAEMKLIKDAAKIIFESTKNEWKNHQSTGKALYQFAEKEAQKLGYTLNLNMDGHRLGDFPHALHYKGSLQEIDFNPIENLWVLEILIKNKEETFGAFFEDILTEKDL